MIFKELVIKDGLLEKKIQFSEHTNLIYSKKNSVGKTTFLRALLYGIGYPIPSTKRLRLPRLEFYLKVENNGVVYKLYRRDSYMTVDYAGHNEVYSLPGDFPLIQNIITGVADRSVLDNLLGAFYVDQEKGWTLLNRGTVIGDIRFSIEELVRGLSNRSCDEIKAALKKVEHDLNKYKYMSSLADYQSQLNEYVGNITYDKADDRSRKEISGYKLERQAHHRELKRITDIINNNEKFVDFISQLRLIVQTDDGKRIPVTKENLLSYRDTQSMLLARKNMLAYKIKGLDKQISTLEASINKEITLMDDESIVEKFDKKIRDIRVDQDTVYKIIKQLSEKRSRLKKRLEEVTKVNNDIIVKMYDYIVAYCNDFSIPMEYLSESNNFIFTDNLTVLSGAIFHKIVFAFKLSYVRLIREKTGLVLPIILDSPSGREVEADAIKEMLDVLQRDFSMHQIIIASIHDFKLHNRTVIEFKERLFE